MSVKLEAVSQAKGVTVARLGRRALRHYESIRQDCALVTATDAKHAPYLFNAIASIRDRFPSHPRLYVYDLGMTIWQRSELSGLDWLELRSVDKFVGHWNRNWSWKPYIVAQVERRYVLYFDAANIVLYRPLHLWFSAISQQGYFLIKNGQQLQDITPSDYWSLFDVDAGRYAHVPTFGAGLFGLDKMTAAGSALDEALEKTRQGWSLGSSADELRRSYDRSIVRDCASFRADQTLLNLAFRKQFGAELMLRDELRYVGLGGAHDHPRQFLWYARRKRSSLLYFWTPLQSSSTLFWFNRITAYARIVVMEALRDVYLSWTRTLSRWGAKRPVV